MPKVDYSGGVLSLPRNWRDLLLKLLAARDLEERKALVAHLTDEQKESMRFEYRMERQKASGRNRRPS